ncbi:hypothetical protein GMOD_00010039 [Pyrenophora seminiperda CCB06]|uniref:Uncharacterized protein n=1 Tax=Pyrenophora seminiperda CCB06 TaxID=1302712 RepID=A0A3M7M1Q0_9PLEO|nr:hypothetical protein GMOD_00010039 [Pyrenophora seminiperda CCB06]
MSPARLLCVGSMRAALRILAPSTAEGGGAFATGECNSVSTWSCWAAAAVSASVSASEDS